ncbi:MAG: metallophosphoesterase family protein [Phycisphaerae bacterium]
MTNEKSKIIESSSDGIDRRGFLHCMAWAGTAVLWSMKGGILTSCTAAPNQKISTPTDADFSFVQISDSHIGFSKQPNQNVIATLEEAVRRINNAPTSPDLLLHTGDLTHLSKPAEFDTVQQIVNTIHTQHAFYVPGEHDVFTDDGAEYFNRFGKNPSPGGGRGAGGGWYSFNHKGAHFIALTNVMNLKSTNGGLGQLGPDQLAWLKADLMGLSNSTPIILFAHVPLWTIYEKWGWGTADSAQALQLLRRFGSVTVLNGHIHQVLQKIEGNITFHTARSTAFPQPAPGSAPSPGPMKNVPADQLKSMLGLTQVRYTERPGHLAIIDPTLAP